MQNIILIRLDERSRVDAVDQHGITSVTIGGDSAVDDVKHVVNVRCESEVYESDKGVESLENHGCFGVVWLREYVLAMANLYLSDIPFRRACLYEADHFCLCSMQDQGVLTSRKAWKLYHLSGKSLGRWSAHPTREYRFASNAHHSMVGVNARFPGDVFLSEHPDDPEQNALPLSGVQLVKRKSGLR